MNGGQGVRAACRHVQRLATLLNTTLPSPPCPSTCRHSPQADRRLADRGCWVPQPRMPPTPHPSKIVHGLECGDDAVQDEDARAQHRHPPGLVVSERLPPQPSSSYLSHARSEEKKQAQHNRAGCPVERVAGGGIRAELGARRRGRGLQRRLMLHGPQPEPVRQSWMQGCLPHEFKVLRLCTNSKNSRDTAGSRPAISCHARASPSRGGGVSGMTRRITPRFPRQRHAL